MNVKEEILRILEDGRDLESLEDKVDWLFKATKALAVGFLEVHNATKWILRLVTAMLPLLATVIGLVLH